MYVRKNILNDMNIESKFSFIFMAKNKSF